MRVEPVRAADWLAILIGVGNYTDSEFPRIPAAGNSLRALQRVLADPLLCAWPGRIATIHDPASRDALSLTLADHAERTTGVLLLYYVGHGTLSPRGDLCLTVTTTRAARPAITGVPWADVAEALRTSPARTRIAILDCCFAGQAIEALTTGTQTTVADLVHVEGVYTLTATTRNRTAHVPPVDQQTHACTSFTGELVDLIAEGIPHGPETLTLGTVYPVLRHRLAAKGLPLPNQRGTDLADRFVLTSNAWRPVTSPTGRPPGRTRAPDARTTETPVVRAPDAPAGIRRRTLVTVGALTTAAVVTGTTVAAILRLHETQDDRLTGDGTPVVAFSHDGLTLVTIGRGKLGLRLWDVATGETRAEILPEAAVGLSINSMMFSPDGKTFATAGFDGVQVRDAATGVVTANLLPGHGAGGVVANAVAFSPDGKTLAVGHERGLTLVDIGTGKATVSLTLPTVDTSDPYYQPPALNAVAFSPDGKTLAGGGYYYGGKGCWLWDVASGHATITFIEEATESVAFSPDGKTVATGGVGGARLWDPTTGRITATFTGDPTYEVAFSPDGTKVASGGQTGARVWDAATGHAIATRTGNRTDTVAFNPDGTIVAVGTGNVRVDDGPSAPPATAGCWLWKPPPPKTTPTHRTA
ncbi:caspase family protein [Kitasatospora sp. NPDC090091]|uniref:caspase, EACC1-associated type n=1 Tax=Kitasatospora sp. NPDC090091 TaxID=3364081 RepID=UPI00380606BA